MVEEPLLFYQILGCNIIRRDVILKIFDFFFKIFIDIFELSFTIQDFSKAVLIMMEIYQKSYEYFL